MRHCCLFVKWSGRNQNEVNHRVRLQAIHTQLGMDPAVALHSSSAYTDLLAITTVAPSLDNISAIPLPSPVPPPVIKAVLLAKQFLGSIGSVLARNFEPLIAREIALIFDGLRPNSESFRSITRDEAI